MDVQAYRKSPPPVSQLRPLRLIGMLLLGLLSVQSLPVWGLEEARSVEEVVTLYGDKVRKRLQPRFLFAGVDWPPRRISLVAFKDTRLLELWALNDGGWQHIKDYRVRAMSGHKGPKLLEGDRQVPEGEYRIELLNPNSAYHLSLKLDYPNAFDRQQAELDGRHNLGGDIFIHGGRVSSGCLAVGDIAAEELFVLAAMIGESNVAVLITPRDYRFRPRLPLGDADPEWVEDLHGRIANRLQHFPLADKR